MTSTIAPHQLYRAVLRQFVQNSIHPRASRSPTISLHLRQLFETARTLEPGSAELKKLVLDAQNMVVYLKSHRLHKALVERYNPTNTLSGEERARMSAKMVGLDMPAKFADGVAPSMEAGRPAGMGKGAKKGTGSLQTMFSPES